LQSYKKINIINQEIYTPLGVVRRLRRVLDTDGVEDVTKDATQDKELKINSLEDADRCLRSLDDLRRDKEEPKIKSKVDDLFLKVLTYCVRPKTREEIFEHVEIYNNSRNFRNYIKPIVDLGWLRLTIPDKPTNKNQKYVISVIAKRLVEQKTPGINRKPVTSSNIASVGYDAEKGINKNRLIFKGYGFTQPVATNKTAEGRQLNRRTEFKVLKK